MKAGNIGLWIIAAVFAWAGWIILDVSRAPSGGTSSSISAVKTSKVPVLVEFYADWCGPCKAVGPVVNQLAGEVSGKAQVIRINVDDASEAANEHGIRSIPTFIAFKNGEEVRREVGAISKSLMLEMLGL